MRNAWILYTLIRLGMFFGFFAIFASLGFYIYFAAIIAAGLSFALSLLLLDKLRDQISESVHKKLARGKDGSYADAESDLENAILDAGEADAGQTGAVSAATTRTSTDDRANHPSAQGNLSADQPGVDHKKADSE